MIEDDAPLDQWQSDPPAEKTTLIEESPNWLMIWFGCEQSLVGRTQGSPTCYSIPTKGPSSYLPPYVLYL